MSRKSSKQKRTFPMLGENSISDLCLTWNDAAGGAQGEGAPFEQSRNFARLSMRVWIAICILICFILFDALMRGTASFRIKKHFMARTRQGKRSEIPFFSAVRRSYTISFKFLCTCKEHFMNKCCLCFACFVLNKNYFLNIDFRM